MQTLQIRVTDELLVKAEGLVKAGLYSNTSEVFRDALRRLVYADTLKTNPTRHFKMIFSADIHGNSVQFEKLFRKALEEKADAVIIGGDIMPKDSAHRTPEAQRRYVDKTLIPLISRFNQESKSMHKECGVFLMLGNDDFKTTQQVLQKMERKAGYKLIHNKCMRLHEGFKIAGYSNVPLTPFRFKDWEKLDLKEENESAYRHDYVTTGVRTRGEKLIDVVIDTKTRTSTIEKDLRKLLMSCNTEKMVLVTHSPPLDTSLDMLGNGEHVGSAAVRKIVQERQPLLSLHGHIHETVAASGTFKDRIGKTLCLAPGNDDNTASLAILIIDLFDVNSARREIIT